MTVAVLLFGSSIGRDDDKMYEKFFKKPDDTVPEGIRKIEPFRCR